MWVLTVLVETDSSMAISHAERLALEQARDRVQQEPQERTVRLDEIQRAFHGPPGGGRVAQRVGAIASSRNA